MRTLLIAVFLITFASSSAAAEFSPAAALQKVLDAAGKALGAEHLQTIRAWRYKAVIGTAGLRGTSDTWIDRIDGAEATFVRVPPVSQDTGFDGRDAWTRDAAGIVVVDGSQAGRAAAINALYRDTYALWTPNRRGAQVTLLGRRGAGGVVYDVVRVTPATSAASFEYWFNAASHLPARVVETIGPVTTTTTLSNFARTTAGLRIALSQKSIDSQTNATTLVLNRVDIDPAKTMLRVGKPSSRATDFSIGGYSQTSVPFVLADNHVYLDVKLDGRGPYRFIFDTGGENIVDPAVARAIGARPLGQMQGGGVGASTEDFRFARVASLRIGNAELCDQVFAVVPVRAGFGISGSARVDGLIGWEVLARFVTTFDYGANRLTLHMPTNAILPGKATHFVFGGTQPQMPCAIDRIETVCAIDTGSRASIDLFSPFIATHPSLVPASVTATGLNGFGVGGGDFGRLARLSSLDIGGYRIRRVIAGFSAAKQGAFAGIGVGGNVGGGVWKRFRVTFDYRRQLVALAPNAAFAAPDEYDRSGIFAVVKEGRLIAIGVRPGTPAAMAGVKRGDAIVYINGKSGTALSLATLRAAFRQPAGTVLHLRVMSGSAPRNTTLTLRDYV